VGVIPAGMSVFYHGGGAGVHLVISRDNQKHLADVFVLDLPGPRSAYFIPAVHASMLFPIQADHVPDVTATKTPTNSSSTGCDSSTSLALDYGGWVEEEMSPSKRTGCSPFTIADIPSVRNGHMPAVKSPAKPLQFGQTVRVASSGDGDPFDAMLLGFMDPPSGRVYARVEASITRDVLQCQLYPGYHLILHCVAVQATPNPAEAVAVLGDPSQLSIAGSRVGLESVYSETEGVFSPAIWLGDLSSASIPILGSVAFPSVSSSMEYDPPFALAVQGSNPFLRSSCATDSAYVLQSSMSVISDVIATTTRQRKSELIRDISRRKARLNRAPLSPSFRDTHSPLRVHTGSSPFMGPDSPFSPSFPRSPGDPGTAIVQVPNNVTLEFYVKCVWCR
jgi:hypothetical protein